MYKSKSHYWGLVAGWALWPKYWGARLQPLGCLWACLSWVTPGLVDP